MSSDKTPAVKLKLTPEQQAIVRKATGKNAASIELSAQELEDRIAPFLLSLGSSIACPPGGRSWRALRCWG